MRAHFKVKGWGLRKGRIERPRLRAVLPAGELSVAESESAQFAMTNRGGKSEVHRTRLSRMEQQSHKPPLHLHQWVLLPCVPQVF